MQQWVLHFLVLCTSKRDKQSRGSLDSRITFSPLSCPKIRVCPVRFNNSSDYIELVDAFATFEVVLGQIGFTNDFPFAGNLETVVNKLPHEAKQRLFAYIESLDRYVKAPNSTSTQGIYSRGGSSSWKIVEQLFKQFQLQEWQPEETRQQQTPRFQEIQQINKIYFQLFISR